MKEKEVKKTSAKNSTTNKTNTTKKLAAKQKTEKVVKEPIKMEIISDEKKVVKNNKMPAWATILIILGVFLFILELIYVGVNIKDEFEATRLYEKDGVYYIDKGNLTITSDVVGYYNSENNIYYVEGYLHNNSERAYKEISVSYTIYDIKGNVLGESSTYLSCLDKGKTWNFKSVYDEIDSKKALKFELRKVRYDLDYDD